jgi:hypothetical protein
VQTWSMCIVLCNLHLLGSGIASMVEASKDWDCVVYCDNPFPGVPIACI